jgi:hypothetical protein
LAKIFSISPEAIGYTVRLLSIGVLLQCVCYYKGV